MKFLDNDPDQSFFTWQTVGSFAVMTLVVNVFWFLIPYKDEIQRLLIVSVITMAIMITYSLLSLKWEPAPEKITIARQIFLSIINSIYIIAIISGATVAEETLKILNN